MGILWCNRFLHVRMWIWESISRLRSLWPDPLQWRHNDHDSVSNHQPHGCLLNRLFGRRSKKTSKLRVTGLCAGNSPGPVNSPHKGPVTRKMFPFGDVIMLWSVNLTTPETTPRRFTGHWWTEVHFTNDFSIVIQIRWKFHSALIKVFEKWSLWNLAHDTTAVLLWHVQRFVALW